MQAFLIALLGLMIFLYSEAISTRTPCSDSTVSFTNITGEKPQFLYQKQMASVNPKHTEGDKFEITCEAKGKPNPVVTWYKDGKVFTGSQRSPSPITPGEYDYNITFTGIDVRDAGTYMCNVSNAYGWLTYSYPISVEEKVRTEPQIYFIWEQDEPLYVGENVVIFCRVLTKDPDTKYRWYYSSGKIADEETLGVLMDPRRYVQPPYRSDEQPPYRGNPTTLADVEFQLKIENLTINQSGIYGCEAENAIGFGARQTSLTVTYRPVIPITTGTFTELDTTEPEVSGQGSAKPGNKESWTSRVQYPWVLIGISVAVVIALIVSTWYCWKIKKARVSSRSRRPDIDSLHPRYEVKNEYVVIPDFN